MIAAIIFAYKSFKKKGFEEDMANVPMYLRGGGAMIFYQVKYAIQYPRLLACWVILQYFGMALMITAGILFESVNWAAKSIPMCLLSSRRHPGSPAMRNSTSSSRI